MDTASRQRGRSGLGFAARVAVRFLPSSLPPFLEQLRRDLHMVREGLAGRSPSPLVPRVGRIREDPHPGPLPEGEGIDTASSGAVQEGTWPVEIHLEGRAHRVMAAPGITVLEAGLAAGLPMPYSCTVGGCGTCLVRLLSGEVHLEEPNCLTDEERASGQVLACVSRPVSPVAVEVP